MLAPVETSAGPVVPLPERRAGTRQKLMMRVAKLRCRSGEYPCVIYDVSESGARLRLLAGHSADTHMFLELSNGELYAIERRWIDGEFAGFRFSGNVEIDEFIHERSPKGRRPIRLRLEQAVQVLVAGERSHAVLVDISAQGACFEAGRQIPVGLPMRIEIPGLESRFAHVCWRRDYRHGIVFQEPFALSGLARLATELQPFDALGAGGIPPLEAQAICA